jgi:hypothetical protein
MSGRAYGGPSWFKAWNVQTNEGVLSSDDSNFVMRKCAQLYTLCHVINYFARTGKHILFEEDSSFNNTILKL